MTLLPNCYGSTTFYETIDRLDPDISGILSPKCRNGNRRSRSYRARERAYLIDTKGKRYLDGTSSIWVNLHGHRHPALDRAIKRQLDKVAHSTLFGLSNPPAIQLARALIRIAPNGLTRVFIPTMGRQRSKSRSNGGAVLAAATSHGRPQTYISASEAGLPRRYHRRRQRGQHRTIPFAIQVAAVPTVEADPPYCYRLPA